MIYTNHMEEWPIATTHRERGERERGTGLWCWSKSRKRQEIPAQWHSMKCSCTVIWEQSAVLQKVETYFCKKNSIKDWGKPIKSGWKLSPDVSRQGLCSRKLNLLEGNQIRVQTRISKNLFYRCCLGHCLQKRRLTPVIIISIALTKSEATSDWQAVRNLPWLHSSQCRSLSLGPSCLHQEPPEM